MPYEISIQSISASQPTAVVRRRAALRELSRVVPEACGEVWKVIRAEKVQGAGRNLALYLSLDVDQQLSIEVGVEMAVDFAGAGEVVRSELPAGRVAVATHFGPYAGLPGAHRAVRDWCAANGHEMAGPNWEVYGHWVEEWNVDPSQIRTDVVYLLK